MISIRKRAEKRILECQTRFMYPWIDSITRHRLRVQEYVNAVVVAIREYNQMPLPLLNCCRYLARRYLAWVKVSLSAAVKQNVKQTSLSSNRSACLADLNRSL